jgi:hypothetical protein
MGMRGITASRLSLQRFPTCRQPGRERSDRCTQPHQPPHRRQAPVRHARPRHRSPDGPRYPPVPHHGGRHYRPRSRTVPASCPRLIERSTARRRSRPERSPGRQCLVRDRNCPVCPALPGPPASRKAQGPFPAADLGPVPSIAELLPAALAARDGLHRDGSPLTRDALARRLRQNGHPIRNSRITPLLHALRTETTATSQTEL